jgi:rubrerythrin
LTNNQNYDNIKIRRKIMPTLFADLYEDDGEDDDEEFEHVAVTDTDEEIDLDGDEDDTFCRECGTLIEDGLQCPVCGLMVVRI